MGVFPRDYNTPLSKIIILLTAEGLSHAKGLSNNWEYLRELAIKYSLVLCRLKTVYKNSQLHSSYKEFNANEYKTCGFILRGGMCVTSFIVSLIS